MKHIADKFFLLFTVFCLPGLNKLSAQLPECSVNAPIYFLGGAAGNRIYAYDPSLPVSSATLLPIPSPPGTALAAGPNLYSSTPASTFYTVSNGIYYYYDGTTWVSTGHSAGSMDAINPGCGGGYIFNLDILTGNVWRYDGTSDAILLTTLSVGLCIYDLAADCYGNFYLLKTGPPQKLTKYNSSGVLLNTYTVTGAPPFGAGPGLAIMGNDVYYYDTTLMHGVIVGNNVNFTMVQTYNTVLGTGFSDMASCPGIFYHEVNNVSVCADQLPYNWNGQDYSTAGNYPLTYTSSSGCDSIVELALTINTVPAAPFVISPVNYCLGDAAITLNVTGTGSFNWYNTSSGGVASSVPPVPSTIFPGITNYYVSQQAAGCESPRAQLSVEVYSTPDLGPDKEISICNNLPINLDTLYDTNGLIPAWTFNNITVPNPRSVNEEGLYTITVTNAFGCADTATVSAIIQPPLFASAGNDMNVEYNQPFHLSGSGGTVYEWSPAGLLTNAHLQNPVAVLTSDQTFYLDIKDGNGCTGSDSVHFKVFKGPDVYIPGAFTPNGDGLNDVFKPTLIGISGLYDFRIYNRYGELIFQTQDPLKGWDGTFKGKIQDSNSYVWIIKAVNRNGTTVQKQGTVMLIK